MLFRSPEVVFRQASIASSNSLNSPVALEGSVAQRARQRELAIEDEFVRQLVEEAHDDDPVVNDGSEGEE